MSLKGSALTGSRNVFITKPSFQSGKCPPHHSPDPTNDVRQRWNAESPAPFQVPNIHHVPTPVQTIHLTSPRRVLYPAGGSELTRVRRLLSLVSLSRLSLVCVTSARRQSGETYVIITCVFLMMYCRCFLQTWRRISPWLSGSCRSLWVLTSIHVISITKWCIYAVKVIPTNWGSRH